MAARGVGTPAASMISFANAFDDSILAAACSGPKQGTPRCAIRSAKPSASGASGPTTTRSGDSASAASDSDGCAGTQRASRAMPGFPGMATICRVPPPRRRARTSACSRAPLPMTTTLVILECIS